MTSGAIAYDADHPGPESSARVGEVGDARLHRRVHGETRTGAVASIDVRLTIEPPTRHPRHSRTMKLVTLRKFSRTSES